MNLSRAAQYAIVSMAQLRTTGDPVPCSHLAKRGDMPERFLLQVLRSLVTAGLVKSRRGVDGGYNLAKRPNEITLAMIIEAIDGPVAVGSFEVLQALPSDALSHVARALKHANSESLRQLSRVTLSQLAC
jgi:Rrf2 family protein